MEIRLVATLRENINGFLHYVFEYHRSYTIPRDEVSDYNIRVLEKNKKTLQFKNHSPHSIIQFQGANATEVNGITLPQIKVLLKTKLTLQIEVQRC